MAISIDPAPAAGDMVEYSITYESPYLNPVWMSNVYLNTPGVVIGGNRFVCIDGFDPNISVRDCEIEFRFPREYGMKEDDFEQFVGTYSTRVDYVVGSETERMQVERRSFGGNVVITCRIQAPLPHHVYGLAWNPPAEENQVSSSKVGACGLRTPCLVEAK